MAAEKLSYSWSLKNLLRRTREIQLLASIITSQILLLFHWWAYKYELKFIYSDYMNEMVILTCLNLWAPFLKSDCMKFRSVKLDRFWTGFCFWMLKITGFSPTSLLTFLEITRLIQIVIKNYVHSISYQKTFFEKFWRGWS